MSLNNHVNRSNPIKFVMEFFPVVASLLEFGEAIVETVEMSYIHGFIIHIPVHFISEVVGLTLAQYAIAFLIAYKSKWSKHSVNATLEVVLLLYCVFN
jgi:hypothetical protein